MHRFFREILTPLTLGLLLGLVVQDFAEDRRAEARTVTQPATVVPVAWPAGTILGQPAGCSRQLQAPPPLPQAPTAPPMLYRSQPVGLPGSADRGVVANSNIRVSRT